MYRATLKSILLALGAFCGVLPCWGQPSNFRQPPANGLRLAQASGVPSTGGPAMVPLNPGTSLGFDPYSSSPNRFGNGSLMGSAVLPPPVSSLSPQYQPPSYSPSTPGAYPANPGFSSPATSYIPPLPTYSPGFSAPGVSAPGVSAPGFSPPGSPLGGLGAGSYPSYNGPPPIMPGAGQSAIVNTNPALVPNTYSTTGLYPNSAPSALFPGGNNYQSGGGGVFQNWFGGSPGGGFGGGYGAPQYDPNTGALMAPNNGGFLNSWNNWNTPGSMFGNPYGQAPTFIRLFQGPRIRHTYIHGDKDHDALAINDTDVAIAMVIPNIFISNQPLYLLPSFSFHQWAGPRPLVAPGNTADLPSKAFSAFLDSGWQSDPARILGAELGLRVGVFSDFDAISTESIRIMGRGIGRVRLTPQATLKLGVLYLDRNRVKFLPAGGILWQPNPATRLDLFFPEPKLSAFLTTLGNVDAWWYVAGYYGGGSWTVRRDDGTKDSIDINDVRIVMGVEWGRNEMMRDGRRIGFAEVGYVFDRELLYKRRPADNLDLQDNFVVRVGLGY